MKIAVLSAFSSFDAPVGTKLRRSKYLLIVDVNTMDHKAMINPVTVVSGPAMWKLFAQELLQEGVRVILSGDDDPKIARLLSYIGIRVIGGMDGSVSSAVKQFKEKCMADAIMPFESTQE